MSNHDSRKMTTMPQIICGFKGPYRFLSNFWTAPVQYEGAAYPSAEHAYQAAKTTDSTVREQIRATSTAGDAKRTGRYIQLRQGWYADRLSVMRVVLLSKFSDNSDLAHKLLATGRAELVEDNDWGDTFWGSCREVGENHLGKLLMEIREILRLRQGTEKAARWPEQN